MDRSAYMGSPAASSGGSGGGSFVREEYAFGGSAPQGGSTGGSSAPAPSDNQRNDISCYLGDMPPKRDSNLWAPYGLAKLKPSLPEDEIIEKLRKSSKYFSKILISKEKNLSKIDDSEETGAKNERKEQAGIKAAKEIEELRKDKAKYATWMETLISDEYIKKENDEINVLIVSNIIKISAIASPEIPFRSKEAATQIFEVILEIFPKVVNVQDELFDDYYEILTIFYLYDTESIITDWVGTNCLELTEKLLTSIIKCSELVIPSNPSGMLLKKIGETGSLLVKILVQIFSSMYISVQTLDVVFYYLVQPQKTNFKRCYELCCKALSKTDAYIAVIGAGKIIRESLASNSLFSGKRTGDKLFSVIYSLECTVPGFVNDMVEDIQKLIITRHNDKARYCLWICASEPNSKVLSKISNLERVFQYRPEWTDAQKMQNVGLIRKIIENSNEKVYQIDSYISSLFKDTHVGSKLEMLSSIYKISMGDFSKISDRTLRNIGNLILDSSEDVRHNAMIKLSMIHLSLYNKDGSETDKERVIYAMSYFFNYLIHSHGSDIHRLEIILVGSILSSDINEEQRLNIMEKLFICFNSNGISTFRVLLQNRLKLFDVVRDLLFEYNETSTLKDGQLKKEFLNAFSDPNASTLYENLPRIFEVFKDFGKFQVFYDMYTSGGELSLKSVKRNLSELLERLMNSSINNNITKDFRKLVERSAPLFMDNSFAKYILSVLLKLSKEGKRANILRVHYLTTIVKLLLKDFGFNFLNSINLLVDLIGRFDIQPISDCAMYILKNIFTSNIKFEISSEDKELLISTIMKSLEKGTPKTVKYSIIILFNTTPIDKLQDIVDNLINKFSNNLDMKSSQFSRSFTILSEIARYKKTIKTEKTNELNFPDGFWRNLFDKALDVIENGPRNLTEDYKVISNNDLREAMMDPGSRTLDNFEKKYSFAVSHNGVRLPLSRNQFYAFPLYFDKSTHNITSAINLIYNILTYHFQKDTKLIEKVATMYRDILLERSKYWFDFSQDQELTIKYYISKKLLFLKLNSELEVFLNFTNLVAVSRSLYDTDYDTRSKIIDKIVNNVNRGGVPLLSLLPLILYSSDHNVTSKTETHFRKYTMNAYNFLIEKQQKLSHKYKNMKDYNSFFLSEYSIAYTIICIALTPGYNNFRDMDIIKKSIPVFEAILMSYNNLSKVLNLSLVKNILSEMKESKLSLINEGRTVETPFIDVDYRVWVLAELCLSLGELVFGIFGTTTQTAPDVAFPRTVMVKSKRSSNQVMSMNAIINELCQGTKKPKTITDVIVKSLIKIKKNNAMKEVKAKSHVPLDLGNQKKTSKEVPLVIVDEDDEIIADTVATKSRSKSTRTKKNLPSPVSDSESSTTNTNPPEVVTTNKRNTRRRAPVEDKEKTVEKTTANNETKNTRSKSKKNIPTEDIAPTRVTRSKGKQNVNLTVTNESPPPKVSKKNSKDSDESSNSSTPRRTKIPINKKSIKDKKNKRSSLQGETVNNIDEDEVISIENVSIISPGDGEKDLSTSLFDMAEKEEKKVETRKRRALSRNQENGRLTKKTKEGNNEPLAFSTPYHPNSNL